MTQISSVEWNRFVFNDTEQLNIGKDERIILIEN